MFALSNGHGHERGLVVYHNKFAETSGWIKHSVAYMDKTSMQLIQRTLGEGLALRGGAHDYVLFRDIPSGLEFVRSSRELVTQGLFVELKAYQCHAFVNFREVADPDGKFAAVCRALSGAGVQSVEDRLREMFAPAAVAAEVKPKAKIAKRPAPTKPVRRKKPQATGTRKKNPARAVPEAKPKAKKARKSSLPKPVQRAVLPKKPMMIRAQRKTRGVAVSEIKPKAKKARKPGSPNPARKVARPKKPKRFSSRGKTPPLKKQKRK